MGGIINVAIRLRDGRTFCQERWTNNTPYWFQNPKMYDADEAHVIAYLKMVAGNGPDELGTPQPVENSEYGLIVWDFVSGTILDNNHYSSPVEFDVVNTGGRRINDNFIAMANAGRIFRRTHHLPPMDDTPCDYRTVRYTDTPLLPAADAIRFGQEAHDAEFGISFLDKLRSGGKRANGYDMVTFIVDPSPMTYHWMGDHSDERDDDDNEPLSAAYLAKLKEIGFPMTAEEGLNAHSVEGI